jgi:hypothetical protein
VEGADAAALEGETDAESVFCVWTLLAVRSPILMVHPRLPSSARVAWLARALGTPPPGVAVVIPTSGTTGVRTGVALTYSNLVAAAEASAENLGWLDDDQIACIPTDALPAEVDLVPIETDPAVDGIRAAIVPLTETSAIFIESHRATGHSANNGFGNGLGIGDLGTYGIVVEYLDSDETAPYDPFTNDDSAGTRFLYPAELQAGARGNYGTMAREEWPIQPLTFLGETVETPQVNIDFTASTGFDSITITAKS